MLLALNSIRGNERLIIRHLTLNSVVITLIME